MTNGRLKKKIMNILKQLETIGDDEDFVQLYITAIYQSCMELYDLIEK